MGKPAGGRGDWGFYSCPSSISLGGRGGKVPVCLGQEGVTSYGDQDKEGVDVI